MDFTQPTSWEYLTSQLQTRMPLPSRSLSPPVTMTPQESSVEEKIVEDRKFEVKPGMFDDIKNLYQSKPDDHGRTAWVNNYPYDLTAAAEDAESAKYALLIRNRKCYNGRKSLEIDSIVIQSPLLKASLGHVLNGYPGVTTNLERLTFSAPFKPFVHRWTNLLQALEGEEDKQVKSHLKLLHRVLEAELCDDLNAFESYCLNGVITFSTCWMIFEPGSLIFGMNKDQPAVARLSDGEYTQDECGDDIFRLYCTTIDWDGEDFGYGTRNFVVGAFSGTAKTTRLSAFPLSYHPNIETVKAELIKRGKLFVAFNGYHHRLYQGVAIGEGPWGPIKYNVDSRIIIDTSAWNRFNPDRQVSLGRLSPKTRSSLDTKNKVTSEDYDDDTDDEEGSDSHDGISSSNHKSKTDITRSNATETRPSSFTEAQLLMCCATLRGYSMKDKKWLEFSIGSVKNITFNESAFESLALPQDHKELILAVTGSQAKNKESFDDVIQGKGKGMIMLLSGPPGVGKTLTAESLAEHMRKPLYIMSAGDLGLSYPEVESSLSNVLEMATKWKAILLLDEADIFLAQRSTHDLERNKLVSIFFRILEYYEGVLFLTTNRVDDIDPAFQSRIHISIQYKELDVSSRKQIWGNFLSANCKVKGHAFSGGDLDRLAEYTMNGREIKNLLKTAQLLASKKGEDLGIKHVESVLAIQACCWQSRD